MHKLRLGRQVAQALGVSVRMARELAKSDPAFPEVIVLGPRTRLVDESALQLYVQAKTKRPTEASKS